MGAQAAKHAVYPKNHCLIAVRPDWHEPSDLLGYVSRIGVEQYVVTQLLCFVVAAWKEAMASATADGIQNKAPADMSRFVLSPMPGLLSEVSVQVGQKVMAGEKVAVIEAMKMENILTATADGVVEAVLANKGESLTVDQPLIRFA